MLPVFVPVCRFISPPGAGIHWTKIQVSCLCLRIRYRAARGGCFEIHSGSVHVFCQVQLIYCQVNTLDTELSVRRSSRYWVCQFYLNPFELQRNEFESWVDIQERSFKKIIERQFMVPVNPLQKWVKDWTCHCWRWRLLPWELWSS